MPDRIGYMTITGEAAKRLFNKQSPGTQVSLRVRGTVQQMLIPERANQGRPAPNWQQETMVGIEVEEVND